MTVEKYHRLQVAAGEFQYLEDFGGGEIAVAPKNEDGYELNICYGRYLLSIKESQSGEPITKQELHDQVQLELDKWMIGISENQTYFMGIKDIVIIDNPLERKCCHGHSSCNSNHGTNSDQANDFAFAVLVSSNAKLKEITDTVIYDESNAVDRLEKFKTDDFKPSAFPLFINVHGYTVFSNILNRRGTYALAHTLPISDELSESNWTQFINHDDAYLVASRVLQLFLYLKPTPFIINN